MSNAADLSRLLEQVPVGELAERFGTDEATVEAAVRQALPGLLGGMAVNASDDEGAARLAGAAERHSASAGKLSLDAIDTEDGKKIVKHVLGDKEQDVALALGKQSGSSAIADLIPQLLPILAPLVMQFLAGKLGGAGGGTVAAGSSSAAGGVGGVLGDLLGGLLGGGDAKGSGSSGAGGLGDVLGGLLGGGSAGSGKRDGQASGGLGDLLGGLFGK
ncbi:DUF937 domain-containing protein [Leucobacter allii]|uniref:DUF937 domain-containing protein n=1 Tax=Leucobacter allii TaxID=2932247 RepID=A0ABY4FIU6_9MICO|nr:DUF937 domain-containing protein [Leucobacter allii]UOQ56616.1 DUF937 domain-containing protein [Leucobacter allii]